MNAIFIVYKGNKVCKIYNTLDLAKDFISSKVENITGWKSNIFYADDTGYFCNIYPSTSEYPVKGYYVKGVL
jgi:hypothetical protein